MPQQYLVFISSIYNLINTIFVAPKNRLKINKKEVVLKVASAVLTQVEIPGPFFL